MGHELKVFITSSEATCSECGDELGRRAWIQLVADKGALCLDCADLAHLVFLPAGNPALTRRAKKHSPLVAVVLQWSRSRKRYERQGLLVTADALELAEQQCLDDADARERQRQRAAARRAELDERFLAAFADKIRQLYPACPKGRELLVANHACQKYSQRVGRTQAARDLENAAIHLAVKAHVRHAETPYDQLLGRGLDRVEARAAVDDAIAATLDLWQTGA
ncbi:hypothetical protein XM38_049920 [Halomicronema hongdechloris C2206]|uniref:DUF2293 domain-containing protein n=1 Tax=Halomicronema hongdechloris C2206 TaxID=1641165 RepID=A0A1Z3HUM2_9CYAN|nr:DUF2293 domain-containing protein [Halomicronema hongdechloris]ASC74018.1 hypothetical protein XM38_049920 [Halomicronema hongdechloris C2206]